MLAAMQNGNQIPVFHHCSAKISGSGDCAVATHTALMKFLGRANSPSEPLHRNDGSLGEFALPLDEIFH